MGHKREQKSTHSYLVAGLKGESSSEELFLTLNREDLTGFTWGKEESGGALSLNSLCMAEPHCRRGKGKERGEAAGPSCGGKGRACGTEGSSCELNNFLGIKIDIKKPITLSSAPILCLSL